MPTYPQLQKGIADLTDAATGAVADAQAASSNATFQANAAEHAASAAAVAEDAAKAAQTAAETSRIAADTSAAAAQGRASEATDQAKTASTKAIEAAASATSANDAKALAQRAADNAGFSAESALTNKAASAASAALADQYANAPVNVPVTPGRYSAYHWSEQARLIAAGALIYKGAYPASGGSYPPNPKLGDFYLISAAGTMGGTAYKTGDMLLYDGGAWDRIDNQQTVTSVAGRTGAITLTMADIAGLLAALDAKASAAGHAFTGNISAPVYLSSNGAPGEKYRVGDDAALHDVDAANTVGLKGLQDATTGFLKFGNGAALGWNGQSFVYGSNVVWHAGTFNPGTKQDTLGYTPVQQGTGIGQSTNAIKIGWSAGSELKCTVDTTDLGAVAFKSWVTNNYIGQSTDLRLPGTVRAVGEIISSAGNAFRMVQGNRGAFFRFDSNSVYLMFTKDGDPTGPWNNLRPLIADFTTGLVSINHGLVVNGRANITEINIGGGPTLSNDSGLRVDGNLRTTLDTFRLWATADGWERQPRLFVRAADPGSAASDGDVWMW